MDVSWELITTGRTQRPEKHQIRLEQHKQQGKQGKGKREDREATEKGEKVIELGAWTTSDTQQGNNQNPQQDVGPHCNEETNGCLSLYLSPLTFITGGRQTGKELIR